jgi:hypothetical protein
MEVFNRNGVFCVIKADVKDSFRALLTKLIDKIRKEYDTTFVSVEDVNVYTDAGYGFRLDEWYKFTLLRMGLYKPLNEDDLKKITEMLKDIQSLVVVDALNYEYGSELRILHMDKEKVCKQH